MGHGAGRRPGRTDRRATQTESENPLDDLNASQLNRRIQFRRDVGTEDDGLRRVPDWQDLGGPVYARRRDISDQEKILAGMKTNILIVRFIVRSSTLTRDVLHWDRVVHEGDIFDITGIKEVPPGRAFIEFTAKMDPFS
ncbi:MAG: hypothetical protein CML69_14780 [Rhodobacteraceae bacterium]|nr:hypothetical protein [Paracoccaceae bacterium]